MVVDERESRAPLIMLIAANVISTVGGSMSLVALPWYVYRSTGNTAATGFAATCEFIAVVVASFFAGAVIARLGARRTRVLSDVIAGLAVVAIPVIDALGTLPYGVLLGLVAVNGLLRTPAVAASFVLLREAAARANTSTDAVSGPYLATLQLAGVLGAPTAGVAIALLGAPAALVADAVTFLLSAVIVQAALPAVTPAPASSSPSLRGAFQIFRHDRVLVPLVTASVLLAVLFSGWSTVIAPVYGQTVLGNPVLLGGIFAANGIGAILGNSAAQRLALRIPRAILFPAAAGMGVVPAFAALGIDAAPPIVIGAMLLSGAGSGVFSALLVATEYERIPAADQGHVFGLLGGLGQAGLAIGPIVAGVALTVLSADRGLRRDRHRGSRLLR